MRLFCIAAVNGDIWNGHFKFQIAIVSDSISYQNYQIKMQLNSGILIQIKMHSRHSNNLKYLICVLIDKKAD